MKKAFVEQQEQSPNKEIVKQESAKEQQIVEQE